MAFAEDLRAVAKSAVCGLLANGGNLAAVNIIRAGVRTPATAVAGLGAGLGLLALNYACNYDPNKVKPGTESPVTGCTEAGTGARLWVKARRKSDNAEIDFTATAIQAVIKITGYELVDMQLQQEKGINVGQATATGPLSSIRTINLRDYNNPYITVTGGLCAGSSFLPSPPTWDTPITAPSGCQMIVNLDSFLMNEDGSLRPVMKIRPAAQALATGGVIGGCNFNPVIYVGDDGSGGGDPPWYAPWQDQPDGPGGEPWWWPLLRAAAGGLTAAVVSKLLDEIFAARLPATVYRLRSVCETGTSGGPVDLVREVVIPEAKILDGIAKRLDALPVLDQGLKDFRQPICHTPNPVGGRVINTLWRSTSPSVISGVNLRKRLSYRRFDAGTLEDHHDHWKDFTWQSGPVQVISEGARWGKPQVWASTEAEGKRVLIHAAQIAGVDVSVASHRWIVRRAASPRLQNVLPMKVDRDAANVLWISERDGPDGPPDLLAK